MRTIVYFLAISLGVVFVQGVGEPAAQAAARAKAPEARATDLFSWSCGEEWCFLLLPHQQPRLSDAKIVTHPATVHGVQALVAEIAALPKGSRFTWAIGPVEERLAYPPTEASDLVRRACLQRDLSFYGVPEGPVEEVASYPVPARKARYGEGAYYLDHRVVALPAFTLRYLHWGSMDLGPTVVAVRYQAFEVVGSEGPKVLRANLGDGDLGPTSFEVDGKPYVIEVDFNDFHGGGITSGDFFVWPAAEFERLQKKQALSANR
jgi:hypothetical protein